MQNANMAFLFKNAKHAYKKLHSITYKIYCNVSFKHNTSYWDYALAAKQATQSSDPKPMSIVYIFTRITL